MTGDSFLDLLAFNLKLAGRKTRKNILVSAGKRESKKRLLGVIEKLMQLKVDLYATPGTSDFFNEHGLDNVRLYKIADGKEPNIKSFLKQDRFDLVINILTGLHDYDEASDSGLIRSLCIENGIPLFTDADVAELAILDILRTHEKGVHAYKLSDPAEPWNLRKEFLQIVSDNGGFACYHAHFDKAYLITLDNLKLGQVDMQKKWKLYKYLKENYTREDLFERMSRAVEMMIGQGVTACRTFVDADQTVELAPIQVALEVREKYSDEIQLEFAVQPLEGVLDKKARRFYDKACELADVIGGLPSRDRPEPERHLDYVLGLASEMGKPVDAHVDQENNPDENETELLARKAIEYGLEGRVRAVHAISVAAKSERDQDRIIGLAKDAGLSFIVCPSAAISMKQLDKKAPLHNSIVPVPRLLQEGLPVYLGVDNIYDLFMPFVDGDMWFESRLLMEACRFYDIDRVGKIACDKSGFDTGSKAGIEKQEDMFPDYENLASQLP